MASWEKARDTFIDYKLLEMDLEKYGKLYCSLRSTANFVVSPCVCRCGYASTQNGARLRLHEDNCINITKKRSFMLVA